MALSRYNSHTMQLTHLKCTLQGCLGVAQSVKRLSVSFGSGCDLRILRSSPVLGSELSMESA